jgi:hypothetical protein
MKIKTKTNFLIAILILSTILGFFSLTIGTVTANNDYVIYDPETNTWTIYPTGDDDTDNIQMTLNEASVYPSSTVELTSGTFFLSHSIEAINFDGSFKGAGRGESILQTKDVYPELKPVIFKFYQDNDGTLRVSDMTIFVNEKHIGKDIDGVAYYLGDIFHITGKFPGEFSDEYEYEPSYGNGIFERMELKGEAGVYIPEGFNTRGVNVHTGIGIYGVLITEDGLEKGLKPVIGQYIITDCSFKDTGAAVQAIKLLDSSLTIENNQIDCIVGMDLSDLGNTHSQILNNDIISDIFGVEISHGYQAFFGWDCGPWGPLPEPSSFEVSHNIIYNSIQYNIFCFVCPSWEGEISTVNLEISDNTLYSYGMIALHLRDYTYYLFGSKCLKASIYHNSIISPELTVSPIVGWNAQDILFTDNYITGYYRWGVNPYDASNGWIIKKNIFGKTKEGQVVGIFSIYGIISIEESDDCVIKNNKFYGVSGYNGAVWCYYGNWNKIKGNDYTQSGLLGWDVGAGCVVLWFGSRNNLVAEGVSPAGTSFPPGTHLCNQVLDIPRLFEGDYSNNVAGYAACEHNHNWDAIVEHLTAILEPKETHLPEIYY